MNLFEWLDEQRGKMGDIGILAYRLHEKELLPVAIEAGKTELQELMILVAALYEDDPEWAARMALTCRRAHAEWISSGEAARYRSAL